MLPLAKSAALLAMMIQIATVGAEDSPRNPLGAVVYTPTSDRAEDCPVADAPCVIGKLLPDGKIMVSDRVLTPEEAAVLALQNAPDTAFLLHLSDNRISCTTAAAQDALYAAGVSFVVLVFPASTSDTGGWTLMPPISCNGLRIDDDA